MEKRKKFHNALLKLYYPPPPPQESQKIAEEEPAEVRYTNLHLNADDPDAHDLEEENDACDLGSEKLTRAQRKRIRKRKIKVAASARRTIIGPLLPSDYGDHNVEHSMRAMQSFSEEDCEIVKKTRQDSCEQVSQL